MTVPRISWKHIGVFVCIYTALGFVAWIIWILSRPAKWCGVVVGAGKAAGVKPLVQDCGPILLALIDKLGNLGFVMVVAGAIGLLTWVVITLGANLSFRGPGGIGGDVHGEPAATVTTTTAVTTPTQSDSMKEN